jgi:peptide-methionine (R)-S-oxide reductase
MPRHRQVLWTMLSAVAMVLWIVSMAEARNPIPRPSQVPGSAGQDPFDAAEKTGSGSSAKDSSATADKSAEKAGDKKAAKKEEPEFVRKTLQEWQRILPRAVFQVTRLKATEPAFTGRYATGHFRGTFVCACCDAELFSSQTKFDSGTGWPSFWRPIKETAIDRAPDNSEAEFRVEVMCHRCGAHLGHVFDDGPPPTGWRFCINSLSLKLKAPEANSSKPALTTSKAKSKLKTTKKSKSTAPSSSSNKGTTKTTAPDSQEKSDEKSGGSDNP